MSRRRKTEVLTETSWSVFVGDTFQQLHGVTPAGTKALCKPLGFGTKSKIFNAPDISFSAHQHIGHWLKNISLKRSRLPLFTFIRGAIASASLTSLTVYAQTASQITPRAFAPTVVDRLGQRPSLGKPPIEAPSGTKTIFVTPGRVEITDSFTELESDNAEIRTRLTGRRISGAEIYAAARDLEAAYARAGFVLARVAVPPQEIVDGGAIRLQVIDGFIERFETAKLPRNVRKRIVAILTPFAGHGHVREIDLERLLLLAGDVPGVALRSTLVPGSKTGAVVLILESSYRPVEAVLNGDGNLPQSLGGYQIIGGFNLNSLLGLGEEIYARAGGVLNGGAEGIFSKYARNRVLAGGIIVPLGPSGLRFNVEATLSRATSIAKAGLQSTDQFKRLSFRIRYPWVRGRRINLSSELVLDLQDEEDSLLASGVTLPISLDRVRPLRLVNEADYLAPWGGTFLASLTMSLGLDGLGARLSAQASPILPLSVQEANATFRKLSASLSYNQALAQHLIVALNMNAQTSFGRPLLLSEQIGIAGSGQISGFSAGTLQGDSGYFSRLEVATPFAAFGASRRADARAIIAPYLFGAFGKVLLERPTTLQPDQQRRTSYGFGLRLIIPHIADSSGLFALEYARYDNSTSGQRGGRLTASGSARF
jgi:hemolysin activation/secretion protein